MADQSVQRCFSGFILYMSVLGICGSSILSNVSSRKDERLIGLKSLVLGMKTTLYVVHINKVSVSSNAQVVFQIIRNSLAEY